jgi:hypothetical protein
VELELHTFLTLALDGGEWSAFYSHRKISWFLLDTKQTGLKCWSEPDCEENIPTFSRNQSMVTQFIAGHPTE